MDLTALEGAGVLVIEIALGIVLAVVLLNYWHAILGYIAATIMGWLAAMIGVLALVFVMRFAAQMMPSWWWPIWEFIKGPGFAIIFFVGLFSAPIFMIRGDLKRRREEKKAAAEPKEAVVMVSPLSRYLER